MKTLLKFEILLLFFTVTFLLSGCGSHSTETEPKASNLAGIYRPSITGRSIIINYLGKEYSATNCAIEIDADGKIEFINVLDLLSQGETNALEDASVPVAGTWHLQKSESGEQWEIISEYKKNDGNVMIDLQLSGERPPYAIRVFTWHTGVPLDFVQKTY